MSNNKKVMWLLSLNHKYQYTYIGSSLWPGSLGHLISFLVLMFLFSFSVFGSFGAQKAGSLSNMLTKIFND